MGYHIICREKNILRKLNVKVIQEGRKDEDRLSRPMQGSVANHANREYACEVGRVLRATVPIFLKVFTGF
jgi:hypothetical protein